MSGNLRISIRSYTVTVIISRKKKYFHLNAQINCGSLSLIENYWINFLKNIMYGNTIFRYHENTLYFIIMVAMSAARAKFAAYLRTRNFCVVNYLSSPDGLSSASRQKLTELPLRNGQIIYNLVLFMLFRVAGRQTAQDAKQKAEFSATILARITTQSRHDMSAPMMFWPKHITHANREAFI